MSELTTLRRKLMTLRAYESSVRLAAAVLGLGVALSWSLWAVFGADFLLQLTAPRRVVVIALALLAMVAAYRKRCRPLLRPSLDREELALQVERRNQLSNDLIAALQFDRPGAAAVIGGSDQLRHAVVRRGSEIGNAVDVFAGVSAAPLPLRAALMGATLIATIGLVYFYPGHARAFANRLLLGGEHYPSRTRIESIWIRDDLVLGAAQRLRPREARCPQGGAIEMVLVASGAAADSAKLRMTRESRSTTLTAAPASSQGRLARLREAVGLLEAVRQAPLGKAEALAVEDLLLAAALARADCGPAARVLDQAASALPARQQETAIRRAVALLDDVLQHGATALPVQQVFFIQLPSAEPFDYQVFLGDAWTEPARVSLKELPVVELLVEDTPPPYARQLRRSASGSPRQLRVLEGSRVDLSVVSATGKRLEDVAVVLTPEGESPVRRQLTSTGGDGVRWRLEGEPTCLTSVSQPVHYEVHVVDVDQMRPPSPLRGRIFVRPDQPPRGSAEVVHRVVLPTATPQVEVQAADDFAIGEMRLHLRVERGVAAEDLPSSSPGVTASGSNVESQDENPSLNSPSGDGEPPSAEELPEDVSSASRIVSLLPAGRILLASQLPYRGRHAVPLAPLRLVPGDRLKITLEVRDHRGQRQGRTVYAEPLLLQIADEAGVMAAIGEADELSAQQLNDLIEQQTKIGESP